MQTSSREPAERAPLAREAGSAGPRSGLRWPAERAPLARGAGPWARGGGPRDPDGIHGPLGRPAGTRNWAETIRKHTRHVSTSPGTRQCTANFNFLGV